MASKVNFFRSCLGFFFYPEFERELKLVILLIHVCHQYISCLDIQVQDLFRKRIFQVFLNSPVQWSGAKLLVITFFRQEGLSVRCQFQAETEIKGWFFWGNLILSPWCCFLNILSLIGPGENDPAWRGLASEDTYSVFFYCIHWNATDGSLGKLLNFFVQFPVYHPNAHEWNHQ